MNKPLQAGELREWEQRANFVIEKDLFEAFKQHCKSKESDASKVIRQFIKRSVSASRSK